MFLTHSVRTPRISKRLSRTDIAASMHGLGAFRGHRPYRTAARRTENDTRSNPGYAVGNRETHDWVSKRNGLPSGNAKQDAPSGIERYWNWNCPYGTSCRSAQPWAIALQAGFKNNATIADGAPCATHLIASTYSLHRFFTLRYWVLKIGGARMSGVCTGRPP